MQIAQHGKKVLSDQSINQSINQSVNNFVVFQHLKLTASDSVLTTACNLGHLTQ